MSNRDKEDSHLLWWMKAGSVGGSDPPGPVCPVLGLPPQGSPPSLPGPLCLLSQGTPVQDHHLPGHPDLDTAVSSSWSFPLPSLPPVKVLTLASVSSGRMGPDWGGSLWKRVSAVEEKAQENTSASQLNFLSSPLAPAGPNQAGRGRKRPGWNGERTS